LLLLVAPFGLGVSHFFRHGRQSDSFWQIGKRVNETSSFIIAMVEGAAVTELTVFTTGLFPVFAGNGLVVRVYSTKSGLTEIFRKRIVGLSELTCSMCELAEFLEAASTSFHKMFAKLGLILLLKCVELALIAIKVIVVTLLSEMPEHL
jgi:hypothetical protein